MKLLLSLVFGAMLASSSFAQRSTPAQLLHPDGAAGDSFGSALAISGDTMVVGSQYDDVGANADQGSVHIYRWAGSGWVLEATLAAADGAAGDFFGGTVAISGDTAVVGATGDDVGANVDQGSAYVFVRAGSTWTQQAKLVASDGAASDTFGVAAISGDTIVVGAFFDDVGANSNQGSAYVFTRSGSAWTQQAQLTANDGASGDVFGWSVAVSGDDVVIGARGDMVGANFLQGSAYVFTRSGVTWTQQAKLTASDGAAIELFGQSVAIVGDTVLIGASWGDVGGNVNQGSAYVFTRSDATWTQQAKLTASDGSADDEFGQCVSVSGNTAVIGARLADVGANPDQGSAYVFTRSGSTWTQQTKLTAPDGAANDEFGFAISLFGDTAVIGARFDDVGVNADQGSAWAFSRIGSMWIGPDLKAVASDGSAGDQFGFSIAISGNTALLGAFVDDVGANGDQGSAYAFVRSGSAWVQQAKLTASDGAAQDNFGISVALSGDTAIVGAYRDDVGAGDQGSAYVFVRTGSTWIQQAKLNASDGAASDLFGYSVALSGDTALVGAISDDFGAVDQGSAYVFTRSGTTWTQQARLTASDYAASDQFGVSVALSGETAVIGAYGKNNQQGAAYAFARSGSLWTQQAKLIASDGAAGDVFGISVALSGDTAIVGAYRDTIGANTQQGSAYAFARSGSTWTQQAKLIASDGAASDFFGFSVAVSGDVALIGAYADDVSFVDQGSAYVFVRSGNTWTQQTRLNAADAAAGDQFGWSVALSGGTAVIGTRLDDIGANPDQGSFYSFDIPANDFSLAHNDSLDLAYPTLAAALLPASSGQQLSSTEAAFRSIGSVDTLGRSLGLSGSGNIRTPSTSILTLGGSSFLAAAPGNDVNIFGQLRISAGSSADLFGETFLLGSRGTLTARTGSSLTINTPAASLEGQTRLEQGASLTFYGGATNIGPVTAGLNSSISAGGTITNFDTYSITSASMNAPLFLNRATTNIFGSSAIFGSFANEIGAVTTIRSGTLFVYGSLTNNGTIVGTICSGCLGIETTTPPSLDVGGDLNLGASANLNMPFAGALVHVGGNFDAAINLSARYNMASATLQMEGLGFEQTLEVMSRDIGPDTLGLDRTRSGHFPIGVLEIGPSPSIVRLVDNHDNDALGQSACEAIYVQDLRIDSGSRLINTDCKIYYKTIVNSGTVDVPANLIAMFGATPCPADLNGDGLVEDADFVIFANAYNILDCADPSMPAGCPADLNGDGVVEDADFVLFAAAYDALLCP